MSTLPAAMMIDAPKVSCRHSHRPSLDARPHVAGVCGSAGRSLLRRICDHAGVWLTIALLPSLLQGCAPAVIDPVLRSPHPATPAQYRIQPGDQMDIKFFYTPELNASVTVRPDGRLSLLLVQDIPAAGLTPDELAQILTKSYARELNHPEITVIMRTFEGQRVYVDGEVGKPGIVPLAAGMTVMQSITAAGGMSNTALTSQVLIIRRVPEGKPRVYTVNIARALDGTDTDQDVTLMPFDMVYVPKSTIAKVDIWIDQYLRKSIPVAFGLGYTP